MIWYVKIKNKIWIGISILIGYNVLILKNSFNKKFFVYYYCWSCHDCSFAFYTFFYKQKGKNKKIIHWILWLLTVPFIFWMVQIIAVELIIPGASEPSVRTLRATIPENESRQIFWFWFDNSICQKSPCKGR